jgi:hypothetical protein
MYRHKSGCEKRQRKQQDAEARQKLPKLDSFFNKNYTNTDSDDDGKLLHSAAVGDDVQHSQQQPDLVPPNTCSIQPSTSKTLESTVIIAVEKDADFDLAVASDSSNSNLSTDPADWVNLSNEDISYWIDKGPSTCQNSNGSFDKSSRHFLNRTRFCTKGLFHGKKINGDSYTREWLLYSPNSGSVYCFVCKLFKTSKSSLASDGFNDWRNPHVIGDHENSHEHRSALLIYLTRRKGSGVVSNLEEQIQKEQEYWRHVLERVVAVIRTLAERGLAFRGDTEEFGSPNNGNYLGSLELVAEFDPFLARHIGEYGNKGRGKPSYLSKTICDEIIHLMARKVRQFVLDELAVAGYFSISVDSTPDNSHVDQLTVIVRYVSPSSGQPVERFLNFIKMESHTGENLANLVLDYLCNECKIDFSKCRGQSYDNAANMSGRYNGMQQKILEHNKYAIYIPCAGHSLNLVGRAAVDCCLEAVNFFSIIQQIYTFFSGSTHRWAILETFLAEENCDVPKRLSDTRWEAHGNSTSAVFKGYEAIVDALNNINENEDEKGDARREAGNIRDKMLELEFAFMLVFWNEFLERFNKTIKSLQDEHIALNTCADLYQSLSEYVDEVREKFEYFEGKAMTCLPDVHYRKCNARKSVRRNQPNDGNATEVQLSPKDEFRIKSFLPIIDAISTNLKRRAYVYSNVAKQFAFLSNLNQQQDQRNEDARYLKECYPADIDDNFVNELEHFHNYIKTKDISNADQNRQPNHQDLYNVIFQDGIESVFPNVAIVLRMFLTLMVTNCSGERSFSQLKRIKNELRTTIAPERLGSLSLLCIESEILRELKFEDIVSEFARQKSRKKFF